MNDIWPAASLWLPGLMAMAVLTLVSGFFSASETSLFFLSRDELRLLRIGKPRERVVASLLSDPDRLLTGVLFWNLVVNLSYFAVSVVVAQRLSRAGWTAWAGGFGVLGLVAIILFGEVLPKSLAVVLRQRLATLLGWPLAAALRVIDPVSNALNAVTRVARRVFWPHLEREPYLRAVDLERAVLNSELSDDVIRQERLVLHNILDLTDITVEEIMRPRGNYVCLPEPVSLDDLHGEVSPGDYVVVRGDDDEAIEGAVPLNGFSALPAEHLENAAEDVVNVPWCATVADTLQSMRDRYCSVAVVVNEYGETIGIVTYEDIIDTILMPQPSRTKRMLKRDPVVEVAPGQYQVEGMTTLRHLADRLELDYLPSPDSPVTVAGWLYDELEHIPVPGDECIWQGYHIRVTDVAPRGQLRATVSRGSV